jgi:hypothetical protein
VEWRGDGASGRTFVVGLSYTAVGQLQSIQTEIEDQAGQQPWGAQKGWRQSARVCWRAEEGRCVGRPDQAAARE